MCSILSKVDAPLSRHGWLRRQSVISHRLFALLVIAWGAWAQDALAPAFEVASVRVLHTLRPLGVAMAGKDVFDPFKD